MAKKLTDKFEFDGPLYRVAELNREGFSKEARTVRVVFSTTTPVERTVKTPYGARRIAEILSHDEGAMRSARVQKGTAVLLEHDEKLRVGITGGIDIIGNERAETTVKFSRTPLGEQAMNEVDDGTLKWMSAGYRVFTFEVDDERSFINDPGKIHTARAVDWEPFEASFTGIPADINSRVLRSGEKNCESTFKFTRSMTTETIEKPVAPAAPAVDHVKLERVRISEITALGTRFKKTKEAQKAIEDGTAVADFRSMLLDGISVEVNEQPTVTVSTQANRAATPANTQSIGSLFVASDAYRNHVKGSGQRSNAFEIPNVSLRTTLDTTGITSINKLGGVPGMLDQQPLRIANIIASGSTNATTIRYIQEDSFTNSAAAIAEGANKGESALALSEVDAAVRKVATYLKITDEMLSDHEQMKSFVDNRLAYMVQAKVDYYLLNGTGSNNQIKGILNFSGISTQAVGGDYVQDALFKAITKVRATTGFIEPDAVVIHPSDYQNLRLSKDSNGQYLAGGPFTGAYGVGGIVSTNAPIWGLPAIVTTSISQGTALVGSFGMGAQWFQKLGLTVETTNTDGDDFVKNLVTVRAEIRLALACYKPKAFCTVTGIPA